MATQNDSTFREGQSTTRPPFFDGNDYPYWKTRMRIYLQALDYEIWEVVCNHPFLPLTKNEVGEDIPKPSREWNELEKRKASLSSKAMNALFCALDNKEFHRVSSCECANEIWHKLEVVYEGTNQVKESKISRYTRQYELFQIEQNESVYSMYTRFTDIVNTLGAIGKTFSNSEKVKKIIRSLPKEWRPKRTAIKETKDLNTLPLDDLIGSLISYEEDLAAEKRHEEKKKSIALKALKYESDGESEPNDEELAMLAKRFRKFFKKTEERRNFRNFKNQREKKEVITCYECKKPDHIRSECPLINKLKKKAMVATWDDSGEDSSDEEGSQEVSNLALMTIGEDDDLNEGSKKKKNKWYLDSGYSRHMTENYAWFSSFTKIENGGDVSFGDNSKRKIFGIENVGKVSSTLIENILFVGNRCGNVYIIDIECASTLDKCFSALHDDSWLWHRRYTSLNGKYYAFVIVDDYSRYTCVLFLANKDDAIDAFKVLCKKIQNEKWYGIACIRSDHGGEFENHAFETFDNLGKFDPKSDVGIFLGYSNSSKAYKVYNKRTLVVEELMHITFDESNPSSTEKVVVDNDVDEDLQKESSKDNQKDASHGNQDEQHEEMNVEQNEGKSLNLVISVMWMAYGTFVGVGIFPMTSALRPLSLNFSLSRRHVSLSYTILCHMLSTPKVTNRSLPYGSIITRILRFFKAPITEPVYIETRKLGRAIMSAIRFFKKRGKWEKTTSSKNEDTLIAPEDNRMLNDVYSEDELPDFCLGARPCAPRRAAASAVASSQDDEPAEPAVPPAASSASEDNFQQLFDKVDTLSQQQQQLQFDFVTFRQKILDQQIELLARQRCILGHLGYDPGNSSSPPPS
ncbi:hypothetical protein KPL71_026545 [Citrus sinensis]|uniref:Uncharacterized protein n=1 Tax=Citrus sinensis TaxID=2711 RepID=A0ACB8I0B4_CITSI|nr:hypothetical protein KPL71_026545 [Citrus sinensis]